jgi:nucleotide-binding universal stress UspA family protein
MAVRWAGRSAAGHLRDRRALVVCVWRSPVRHSIDLKLLSCVPSGTVHGFIADFDAAYSGEADDTAREGATRHRPSGCPRSHAPSSRSPPPWRALLQLAAEEHSTLIVAGSERDGLTAALGSVSSGLVQHATSAILAVPAAA